MNDDCETCETSFRLFKIVGNTAVLEMTGWHADLEPPRTVQLYLKPSEVRSIGHLLLSATEKPGYMTDFKLSWNDVPRDGCRHGNHSCEETK